MPTHTFFDIQYMLPRVPFILYLVSCSPAEFAFEEKEMTFETVGCIPVVKGTINGKSTFFIIDTGASISMLNESDAGHFGFRCQSNEREHLVGFAGVSRINSVFSCDIRLGPLQIRGISFKAGSLGDLVGVIEREEGLSIAGIIGADVLDKYKLVIDFGTNTISYYEKERIIRTTQTFSTRPDFGIP